MAGEGHGARGMAVRVLRAAGVPVQDFSDISGLRIERDVLVRPDGYLGVAGLIPDLKRYFSSTHMTALQGEAPGGQRWPLLNLVRQVLKASGFEMTPRRLSDGYGPGRRKRYKRVFDVRAAKTAQNGPDVVSPEPPWPDQPPL